jgi:hypothetical protein
MSTVAVRQTVSVPIAPFRAKSGVSLERDSLKSSADAELREVAPGRFELREASVASDARLQEVL